MHLRVVHTLQYTYSEPVALEPHSIYLAPKIYPYQRLIKYDLEISPKPSKMVKNMAIEENTQHIAYFTDKTETLTIKAEMVIESNEFNIFNFVLFPFETQTLPFQYPETIKQLQQPYLVREGVTTSIEQFSRQIAASVRWNTVDFLMALSRNIRSNFAYEKREVGLPYPPEYTLTNRMGTCRDFAQLFIACCRSLGIAARFVSGYLYGSELQAHELHAWAEVYLPGAGWRGFDPTEGNAVINNHIYLATSAEPSVITPVSGTYRGKANSILMTDILIEQ